MASLRSDITGGEKVRIVIVDDHPVFRLGLRELIQQENDLIVCGEAEDTATAWKEIERLKPEMAIVDLSLKGGDGVNLIKAIAKNYPGLPVLVVSMHDEYRFAERSLLAGARGYIMKQETTTSVVKAIRSILDGKIYLSEKLNEIVLAQFATGSRTAMTSPVDTLSDRELEVFRMIGLGFGTHEIAQQLNLSMKTIGSYRERIKEKLRLSSGNELVRNAIHWVEDQKLQ